jgi:hypothetical protein
VVECRRMDNKHYSVTEVGLLPLSLIGDYFRLVLFHTVVLLSFRWPKVNFSVHLK